MKEFKGTKGEWKQKTFFDGVKCGITESVQIGDNKLYIGFSTKETDANAKLIAAAPELLEALQMMLPHFRKLTNTEIEIANQAHKAINKALVE